MTALRRRAPLFAPLVSSRAVGRTSPMPKRPRVRRNRYGSIFQTILAEMKRPIAVARVLLTWYGRGGQRERAALGVPAYGPPIAGMDDRAAELADALECGGQVGDSEIGERGDVAGAWSTLVDSEAQV